MDVRQRTEEIEHMTFAPWATFSDQSRGRMLPEEQDPIRPVFQRDRDRVLHCKAFRRLKQKTQVFLSPEGDLYRTVRKAPDEPPAGHYKEYGSRYEDEQASPGYYTNFLTRYNVKTEVTATPRTGVARFTFPKGRSHILLNLGEGLTNETGAFLRQTGECEFEGMKLLGTFCYNPQAVFPVYFVMRVNKTPLKTGYWKKQRPMTGVEAEWDPDNGK